MTILHRGLLTPELVCQWSLHSDLGRLGVEMPQHVLLRCQLGNEARPRNPLFPIMEAIMGVMGGQMGSLAPVERNPLQMLMANGIASHATATSMESLWRELVH